jgi:hypothetical protein
MINEFEILMNIPSTNNFTVSIIWDLDNIQHLIAVIAVTNLAQSKGGESSIKSPPTKFAL